MTSIKVYQNGPYVVEGEVTVLDHDGKAYDLSDRPMVVLCRCGGSSTKPFCDGTHGKASFEAAERA